MGLRTIALYYNNRLEEALDASAEMQRIEPNHVVARAWRSVMLIALGRSEEALAELDQGIALDPSGPRHRLSPAAEVQGLFVPRAI